jgi:predicted MFS family arabinose efflux permease
MFDNAKATIRSGNAQRRRNFDTVAGIHEDRTGAISPAARNPIGLARAQASMSARLVALCFGNFMIGTGTLIVPGMLPVIAEGLSVTLPVAGQLITAFAFTVCLGAPVLAGLTSSYDRRRLLVAMQILFFAGHAAAAALSGFSAVLAARVLTSIGAALYTAQAAATAAVISPPGERGRAIAFVFLGWSIASVVGMPLGAYIGATFGWRAGFAVVAVGSLAAAATLQWILPAGIKVQPIDAQMWRSLFLDRTMLLVIGVTALQAAAQFAVFSYFVPGVKSFVAASPALMSALLAAFGLTGVVGNIVAGRLIDRFGAATVVLTAMLAMLVGHLFWPWSNGALPILAIATLAWGSGCFAVNSAQQARLVALSPPHAPVSIALNTSGIYLGQAVGTVAGGVILSHVAGVQGYVALAYISVPLFLAAIALSLTASRRARVRAPT